MSEKTHQKSINETIQTAHCTNNPKHEKVRSNHEGKCLHQEYHHAVTWKGMVKQPFG